MSTFIRAISLLVLLALVCSSRVYAADACSSHRSEIDTALCQSKELQVLVDTLASKLLDVKKDCFQMPSAHLKRLKSHVQWLGEVKAAFSSLKQVSVQDYLGSTFTQRADELEDVYARCRPKPVKDVVQLNIATFTVPNTANTDYEKNLILVRTEPKFIGERINRRLLGDKPPKSTQPKDIELAYPVKSALTNEERREDEGINISIVERTSRLLLVDVMTNGCQMKCWSSNEQMLFDLRSGDWVEPADLIDPPQRRAFDRFTKKLALATVSAYRRNNRKALAIESEAKDQFEWCVKQWDDGYRFHNDRTIWLDKGRWRVDGPTCTAEPDAMPPPIEGKTLSTQDLFPYLSAYGKSLILNLDDVRSPIVEHAACVKKGAPPDPLGLAKRVKSISSSEDHAFLLEESGRVWAWGDVQGEAFGLSRNESKTVWVSPLVMGDGYAFAGAGQGFSALLSTEGNLLTMGSNYQGRLGAEEGVKPRVKPSSIGQNFASASVSNYGGWALDREGTLWRWGGEKRPRIETYLKSVKSFRGDYPLLILKDDKTLWATHQWNWVAPGKMDATPDALQWHGSGFERLGGGKLQLAWRADGSAWAWGRTLSSITESKELAGLGQSPWPRLVARDWLDMRASDNSNLVAARKRDDSLWINVRRGRNTRMERVSCGVSDMAFVEDQQQRKHLLALQADGTLLDYQRNEDESMYSGRSLLENKPKTLAKNIVKIFIANEYHGNVAAAVYALRQDGTIWQWHNNERFQNLYLKDLKYDEKPVGIKLAKLDFPADWFRRESAKK